MVCALFPLGIGPQPDRLADLAPGILWVVALLASLLATDSLFRGDFDDATLEQMLLTHQSLYPQVLAKTLAHWLMTGLPLSLLSPILGLLLHLPGEGMVPLMLSLVLGTSVLQFYRCYWCGINGGPAQRRPAFVVDCIAAIYSRAYFWQQCGESGDRRCRLFTAARYVGRVFSRGLGTCAFSDMRSAAN